MARGAFLGEVVVLEKEVPEIVGVRVHDEDHIPPGTPVASVGAALGHEFLAPETGAAVSAVAGFGKNADVIDEHDLGRLKSGEKPSLARFRGLGKRLDPISRLLFTACLGTSSQVIHISPQPAGLAGPAFPGI
jgi:hypothetical protein